MTTQAQDARNIEVLPLEPPSGTVAGPPPSDSRCQHRYDNGTRCRHSAADSQLGLCPRHIRLKLAGLSPAPDDPADLSPQLLRGIKFSAAEDLREFLTRLLIQMAKGRVSPRRAFVLAYITNQLLHSHCVALKEEKDADNQFPAWFFEPPSPKPAEVAVPETALSESTGKVNTSTNVAPPAKPNGAPLNHPDNSK